MARVRQYESTGKTNKVEIIKDKLLISDWEQTISIFAICDPRSIKDI